MGTSHTALVVIDVQVGVMAEAHEGDRVIENIATLVDRARAAGIPVVWVQHSASGMEEESAEWEIVSTLAPLANEPRVRKKYGDSFESTDLREVLDERDVSKLVIVGAQTDACVRSTLHGALARGYDATLVSDAHTTEDMRPWGSPISPEQAIGYTNLYWSFSRTAEHAGSVVPTADVAFTE